VPRGTAVRSERQYLHLKVRNLPVKFVQQALKLSVLLVCPHPNCVYAYNAAMPAVKAQAAHE